MGTFDKTPPEGDFPPADADVPAPPAVAASDASASDSTKLRLVSSNTVTGYRVFLTHDIGDGKSYESTLVITADTPQDVPADRADEIMQAAASVGVQLEKVTD